MKILIFYTHRETLGHTIRVLNIAKKLSEENEVIVLNGGKKQDISIPKNIKLINIPYVLIDRHAYCGIKNVLLSDVIKRTRFIKKIIDGFIPDIFITEHFPFGRAEDKIAIISLIKYIKSKNPNVKIISSVGYPLLDRKIEYILDDIKLYDKIFIHTTENDFNFIRKYMDPEALITYNDFFENIKENFFLTGYVIDEKYEKTKNEKTIVVSRGGGAFLPKIILYSLKAASFFPDYKFIISAGMSSNEKEMELFKKNAIKNENIHLYKHIPNIFDMLSSCSVSISASGYNTATQLLFLKKNSILVPLNTLEQRYRAYMLQDMIGSSVIENNDLKIKKIVECLDYQLNNNTSKYKIDKNIYNGIEIFNKELNNL